MTLESSTPPAPARHRRPTGSEQPPDVVALRPLATPLPLAFLGLAVATTSFATVQVGWLSPQQNVVVAFGVVVFAVPLQLVAAALGFLARDPVAGTGVGVLAGTWAATCVVSIANPAHATHPGLGIVLLCAAAVLLVPAAAGLAKLAAVGVLAVAALRFAVTGVYEVTASHTWMTVSGWVGIALGVVAVYAALAFELEGAYDRTVLPTGRRTPVTDQGPPGVRAQL
jgi:succinate-acetate transporter protein